MTTITLRAHDPSGLIQTLCELLPRRVAEKLFQECGGSAVQAIEIARSRTGRAWDRIRAAELLHERALLELAARGPMHSAPAQVRAYLTRTLGARPYEVFAILFLDNRHQLIGSRELFRGTIDGANVYPREVVREVLVHNAAAVILAHNHPSGVAEPSHADELITQRVKEALAIVDVRVLDHLIVGAAHSVSFAERGLI